MGDEVNDVSKQLCKLKKSFASKGDAAYRKLVDNPRFLCRNCGRVANKKKLVCKASKLG